VVLIGGGEGVREDLPELVADAVLRREGEKGQVAELGKRGIETAG
jgi:hypothetical protein